MKEFTRIITVQATEVRQFDENWADDVEIASMKDKKNLTEQMKLVFRADDVVANLQLFIRDVEG